MTSSQQISNQWKNINHAEAQTRFNHTYLSTPTSNQNYVPFLAKSNRFLINKQERLNPPVGAYNVPSCFDKKKSYIEERAFHFLLQAQKKKQEMTIFKSSLNRFQKIVKNVPGPAAYNLFGKNQEKEKRKIEKKQKKAVELGKSCPSIPHKENKYGYAVEEGHIKSIEKDKELLQKQRESRKQYLSTLEGESQLRGSTKPQLKIVNERKRLYDQTHNAIASPCLSESHLQRTTLSFKRPKYEHLYHSKPMDSFDSQSFLGPGSYNVNNEEFNPNDRKEKFQFFGSTEVRFKDKTNEVEKGYSLIEMIKENKKSLLKEKKSPLLSKAYPTSNKTKTPEKVLPGPGQYDPKDQCLKKSRGVAFFPQSERFQGTYQKPQTIEQQQLLEGPAEVQKKVNKSGRLKKSHLKNMQKVYKPMNSSQICGILSDPKHFPNKQNHLLSVKSGDLSAQEISSWSREDNRGKKNNQYVKQLKDQLAFISQTPRPQQFQHNQRNKTQFKTHKKD